MNKAYTLCGIAQKAQVIPEMKTLIDEGKLHISNARRIVSIITPENQTQWLEKATTLSQNNLRREIVTHHPEEEAKPRIKPITESSMVIWKRRTLSRRPREIYVRTESKRLSLAR